MLKSIILLIIISSAICIHTHAQQQNALTSEEKEAGWQLLFNGKDLSNWHSYLQNKPGKAWKVMDEAIVLDKNDKNVYKDYADLTSDQEFADFDLKLEWKIEPCANSGLLFYVHESPEYKETYQTGPEMQIVDLDCSAGQPHSYASCRYAL